MENRHLILLFLCWFCCLMPSFLVAQEIRFQALPDNIGMANTTINDIIQDQRGFIWFATWSGLYRFDGYEVVEFHAGDDPSKGPASNKITTLYESRDGTIWVGTRRGGVSSFDPITETFSSFQEQHGLKNLNVWAITEDSLGNLFVGTEKGLFYFDHKKEVFQLFLWEEYPDQNFINDLLISPEGLWIGSEGGLFLWKNVFGSDSPKRIDLHSRELENRDPVLNNYIYELVQDPFAENTVWIGTKGGLKKLSLDDKGWELNHFQNNPKSKEGLSHNFVRDIYIHQKDGEKRIWLATYHGFNLFRPQQGSFENFFANDYDLFSLKNDCINSLFRDRSGILWLGSDKGVSKLNLFAKPFETIRLDLFKDPNKNLVSSLSDCPFGKCVLVGTRGGGIARVKRREKQEGWEVSHLEFGRHRNSAKINFVSSLAFQDNGDLWVATQGEGVLRVPYGEWSQTQNDLKDYDQFRLEGKKVLDNYAMSTFIGKNDEVWLGYWDGGLDCYLPSKDKFLHFPVSTDGKVDFRKFPNVVFYETLDEDGQVYLWLGTRGGGFFKLKFNAENESLILVRAFQKGSPEAKGLQNDFVNCFYEDKRKRLWIGTENGLHLFDREKDNFFRFTSKDGLSNNIIQSIIGDEEERLWISTHRGLNSFQFEDGKAEIYAYFKEHGLQDNVFSNNSVFRSKEGQVFFGGVSGINAFYPKLIKKDTLAPQVSLTSISLFNKALSPHSEYQGRNILTRSPSVVEKIDLDYTDRVISIGFAGLHFAQPNQNQYAYKLEGFDEDWIYKDAQHRIAHYTNLPYRSYTFKVKAANADGSWNSVAKELAIDISPPIWLTTGAKILYVFLFIGLIIGIRQITLMRLNFQNKLKLARLEREKLEEVDRMKTQFFTNISHELRTPLTLILSPLEDLIRDKAGDLGLRKTFNRMQRNGNRLLNMINQILDLRKSEEGLMKLRVAEGNIVKFAREILISFEELLQHKNLTLNFHSPSEEILLWFDRDQMEKVFFNLISNAIKFTPVYGDISCKFEQVGDKVIFKLSDTGVGIPEEDIPHIFDRFFQADGQTEKNAIQGSGIGLALSKNIVEAHRGSISVTSEEGVGSQFTLTFQEGEAHFSSEEKLADFKGSEELSMYLPKLPSPANGNGQKQEATHSVSLNGEERRKVLLVEDNDDIRLYLSQFLSKNFEVSQASNGAIGLKMALESPPDLIVSDIAMPEMNGIELCKEIKTSLSTSHIPVILLTARTSLVFKITGYETGADDYITKPFQTQLLESRIHNLIATRENLRKKFSQGGYELSPSQVAVGSLDEEFLVKVISTIEENMGNPDLTVEDLGSELGMSRMQLYRKLKALTGESPNQVIRNIRLKRAAQLLKTQQYTVAEVTYQVGFQDLKYFRERFKKEYGISPSEFKAQEEKA